MQETVQLQGWTEGSGKTLELSIDETQPASFHYEIGKRSTPLIRVTRFCEYGCGGVDCAYEQQEN